MLEPAHLDALQAALDATPTKKDAAIGPLVSALDVCLDEVRAGRPGDHCARLCECV